MVRGRSSRTIENPWISMDFMKTSPNLEKTASDLEKSATTLKKQLPRRKKPPRRQFFQPPV
jgi:hypothetical protein